MVLRKVQSWQTQSSQGLALIGTNLINCDSIVRSVLV